jgi:hypothetical protein
MGIDFCCESIFRSHNRDVKLKSCMYLPQGCEYVLAEYLFPQPHGTAPVLLPQGRREHNALLEQRFFEGG